MRNLLLTILLILLTAPVAAMGAGAETLSAAGADVKPDRPDADLLGELVAEALANSPDLQALQDRWRMNEYLVPQAESLEDPVLSLGFNNYPVDTLAGDQTPMTGRVLRLSQKFPFPGKLAVRGEVAGQKAEWYRAAFEDEKLQLQQRVKDVFYRIYYLDRGIEIMQKNISLLEDFTRLAETRYEVGQGLQQDVLRAQVERSRLMDRLFSLRQQRETAVARLNTLLARPTGTALPALAEVEVQEMDIPLDHLQERSEAERPFYAAYSSLVERFRAERKLARLNYLPDFSLGAAYTIRRDNMVDDGTDFVGLEFSMNLPVYREKRHAAVAEAESGIRMALQQYDSFRNQVYFNIHDAYAEMEKNRKLIQLYESGIIPQAGQAYQAAVSAYQVGRVDFLTLLDALTRLYQDNLEYYRLVAAYEQSLARLEAESGVSLGAGALPSAPDHSETHPEGNLTTHDPT